MKFIRCKPIYQERVWGGRDLEDVLGRTLPADKVIGESWEIVDRPEANSKIQTLNGESMTLAGFREANSAYLMGPNWPQERPFPILVKWLDCQERLSLQVHPPASVSEELKGEPKTENWYIVRSKPGAALLAGLKRGVTREQFEQGLQDNSLESMVCRLESAPGRSLFVRSGRLHAIDAGNLILEIQQNSDTTYRVYDWGRVGLDGKPRDLHVDQSLRSIDFEDFEPSIQLPEPGESILADSEEFRLRRLVIKAGEVLSFGMDEEPRILSVVEGELTDGDGEIASMGDNLLLPYGAESKWKASGDVVCLITDRFNRP